MKVSGFTFLRNGQKLGYPFAESIRSVLPIVDEFVVALGPCEDDTEKMLRSIGDPKIRIIPTQWNERIRSDYSLKGFVYGQQKSIALFNCTGDWAFYLEGDEVVHENDLPKIRGAMERYLDDDRVEALAFDYLHFYGNANTYAWSPRWYRTEVRIVRNTIPVWGPKGLFFVVPDSHATGHYPRAAHTGRDDLSLRLGAQRNADESQIRRRSQVLGRQTGAGGGLHTSGFRHLETVHRHASESRPELAAARRRDFSGRPELSSHFPRKKTSHHAETGAMVWLPLQQETLQAGALNHLAAPNSANARAHASMTALV